MKHILIFIATLFLFSVLSAQTTWTPDKNHVQLHFSAVHFGIAHIEGIFKTFDINLKSEKEDFSDAEIEMKADVKSIYTQIDMRDNDLRSSNWFDTEKFPSLIFKSTSFKKIKEKNYQLLGNITIHGITKAIVFDVVFNGWAVTMTKKQTAGFTVTGKLNRSDFNLGGTPILTGVSDEIEVWANVEIGKN
jgi:polyisoprenoid-binding protein YceI